MRTYTGQRGTVYYPDEICFAFNPMLIKVSGTGYDKVKVYVDTSSTISGLLSETRYPNADGQCWADIQSYAQGFFDRANWGNLSPTAIQQTGLGMTIYYNVTMFNGSATEEFTATSYVIWGSMTSGEEYNGYRRLKWFTNYPFSIGLYANAASTIALCNDGSPTLTKNLSGKGVWNIPLTSYAASRFITVQDNLGTLSPTTFDDTFDLTFSMQSSQQGRVVMRIDLDKTTNEGIYLRWIDRHGFYVYHLFKRGDEQRKVDTGGNFIRENMMQYNDIYGYNSGNGRQQWMERNDVQPLCVPLVDKETWDFLFGVCCSPIVDMFAGYDGATPKWKPVRVQAGTYTRREKDHLQDFICNLLMPHIEYQMI